MVPLFDLWTEINHGGPHSGYTPRPHIDHLPAIDLESTLWMSRAQDLSHICTGTAISATYFESLTFHVRNCSSDSWHSTGVGSLHLHSAQPLYEVHTKVPEM